MCAYEGHDWRGGVCAACGERLRCVCGRFVKVDDIREHINGGDCPFIAALEADRG